jgi:predicted nucleotidyltransferase
MPLRIEVPLEEIARYCRANKIARLRAFGSVLRDDFTDESDVDLLVAFERDARISLLDHVRMKRELSAIIGRQVDLVSEKGISKNIMDEVFAEAEVLFCGSPEPACAGLPAAHQRN